MTRACGISWDPINQECFTSSNVTIGNWGILHGQPPDAKVPVKTALLSPEEKKRQIIGRRLTLLVRESNRTA